LSAIRGYAADSGEGRWAVEEAVRLAVPAPVTASALFARFASRQDDSPGMRVIAALRNQFGGHALVRPPGDDALLGHVTGDAVDDALLGHVTGDAVDEAVDEAER
jgi:hypothetical protein